MTRKRDWHRKLARERHQLLMLERPSISRRSGMSCSARSSPSWWQAGRRVPRWPAGSRAQAGEPDEDTKAHLEEALRAADEAYRRHLAVRAAHAA